MSSRGEKFLRFCGFLFIIEGVIGIITYGIMSLLLGMAAWSKDTIEANIVIGIAVLYLIASAVSLIAGVMGIKCQSKDSAKKCLWWGLINLILTFAAGMWSASGEAGTFAHYAYSSAILVIPSLYIAGAYMCSE